MIINFNDNFRTSYTNAELIIDNVRDEVIKFRQTGEWDSFEEIIGFPYQFNANADPLKKKSSKTDNRYGRVFSNTIIKDNSIVFFEPGKPKFMTSNKWFESKRTKEIKQEVIKDMIGGTADGVQEIFEKGGFKYDSRYYSFQPSFIDYMNFVNSMASYVAVKMGLANERDNVKLMRIARGGNTFTKTMVPFYFDANSTKYSEGGSNSTGESAIFGSLKKMGSLMREADFIFNGKATEDSILSKARDSLTEGLGSIASKFGTPGDALNNIMGAANMTLKGANLMFPEIWQDSSYKQTITVGFKFVSPYGDKLSIFNNVMYPIICLLALALPRQVGAQGYTGPFLIKCFCKGWFNCDLGMIESIEVDKGPGNSWSSDSLPLEATVTVTIKDLYSTLMMTAGSGGHLLNNNTGLIEYLETMSGLSVTNPDIFAGIKTSVQNKLWSIQNSIVELGSQMELSKIGQMMGATEEVLRSSIEYIDELFFKD